MIYRIKEIKNKLIEKAYKEGMKEFNKFFGFGWTKNTPNVCILNNRKEINSLRHYKTEEWVVAFADGRTVYILDNKKMKTESNHQYHSDKRHITLLKHELCHLFYDVYSKGYHNPIWLTEGVSIYLSGQLKEKKPIEKFSNFLDFYEHGGGRAYSESGTAVRLLKIFFGKKKILKLISNSRKTDNKNEFTKLFKKIYGFELNYKNFNNLLNKQ